jgi:hypothetical protein
VKRNNFNDSQEEIDEVVVVPLDSQSLWEKKVYDLISHYILYENRSNIGRDIGRESLKQIVEENTNKTKILFHSTSTDFIRWVQVILTDLQ